MNILMSIIHGHSSDDGMHPQDKSTWFLEDLIEEHERYVLNETTSHIGLKEYEE